MEGPTLTKLLSLLVGTLLFVYLIRWGNRSHDREDS